MLEQITMAADYGLELRDGIEGRNKDSEDSPEVSINATQAMPEQACLLDKAGLYNSISWKLELPGIDGDFQIAF